MLRLHFLQQWFGLSDLAMEEALFDVPLYRTFAGLGNAERLPDRVSILRFRHLLEEHELALQILATVNATLSAKGLMLKSGTAIDATLIAAPTSTKNSTGTRDPQMHQTKKGNQWYHGMKSHIGIDADSGLVHSVVGTAASVNDVTQAHRLVHGEETDVFADAGYQGVEKREETQDIEVRWHVAMRPGKRKALDRSNPMGDLLDKLERVKASIRAKVEHPFRVIKRQFGYTKVRYRGLGQKHCAAHDIVCSEQLVDEQETSFARIHGVSTPALQKTAAFVPIAARNGAAQSSRSASKRMNSSCRDDHFAEIVLK
jgi:IS5 family transposase